MSKTLELDDARKDEQCREDQASAEAPFTVIVEGKLRKKYSVGKSGLTFVMVDPTALTLVSMGLEGAEHHPKRRRRVVATPPASPSTSTCTPLATASDSEEIHVIRTFPNLLDTCKRIVGSTTSSTEDEDLNDDDLVDDEELSAEDVVLLLEAQTNVDPRCRLSSYRINIGFATEPFEMHGEKRPNNSALQIGDLVQIQCQANPLKPLDGAPMANKFGVLTAGDAGEKAHRAAARHRHAQLTTGNGPSSVWNPEKYREYRLTRKLPARPTAEAPAPKSWRCPIFAEFILAWVTDQILILNQEVNESDQGHSPSTPAIRRPIHIIDVAGGKGHLANALIALSTKEQPVNCTVVDPWLRGPVVERLQARSITGGSTRNKTKDEDKSAAPTTAGGGGRDASRATPNTAESYEGNTEDEHPVVPIRGTVTFIKSCFDEEFAQVHRDILDPEVTTCLVGMHPDQATEPIVDIGLRLNIPFAVVPCCVFPSENPHRHLKGCGTFVETTEQFIQYLKEKIQRRDSSEELGRFPELLENIEDDCGEGGGHKQRQERQVALQLPLPPPPLLERSGGGQVKDGCLGFEGKDRILTWTPPREL